MIIIQMIFKTYCDIYTIICKLHYMLNIIIISKACILTKLFKELNHLLHFDWLASHAWKDIK